eukprot:701652-Amphidinium_carterae.1
MSLAARGCRSCNNRHSSAHWGSTRWHGSVSAIRVSGARLVFWAVFGRNSRSTLARSATTVRCVYTCCHGWYILSGMIMLPTTLALDSSGKSI